MVPDRGRACSLCLALSVEVALDLALVEESGLAVGHRGGRGAVVSGNVRGLGTVSKASLVDFHVHANHILADDLEYLPCDGDHLACRLCPLCDQDVRCFACGVRRGIFVSRKLNSLSSRRKRRQDRFENRHVTSNNFHSLSFPTSNVEVDKVNRGVSISVICYTL